MTNPYNQQGDPYHAGQDWTGGTASGPPPDTSRYVPSAGYGYPAQNQQPQYGAPPAAYPGYPPNATGQWADYSQQQVVARMGPSRPAALTGGAALSFLTGTTIGILGAVLLTGAAVGSSVRSNLSSPYGSSLSDVSGIASEGLATLAVVSIILLVTAILLLWGGIDAALARSTAMAIVGNIIAAVLALIVVIVTSAWLLVWMVLPVLAVILLIQGSVRAHIAGRTPAY